MSSQSNETNPSNTIARTFRKTYTALGFSKGYNALLWFHLAGAMFGFCLARTPYLAVNTYFRKNAAPGEWFYFRQPFYRAGIILHLAVVIPAGVLAAVQFTPVLRRKALMLHRINGYVLISLVTLTNVSGLMIARRSFGGTVETQMFVGLLALATTVSMAMAWTSIKRLQIAQHRAWMLRCVSLLSQEHASSACQLMLPPKSGFIGTPITVRMLMPVSAVIIGRIGGFYTSISCEQIAYAGATYSARPDPNASGKFAACQADPNGWTAVKANLYNPQSVAEAMAGLQMGFGMAGLLAFFIHAVAVEVYLGLTPAESERLRRVSWERRVERGLEKGEDDDAEVEAEERRRAAVADVSKTDAVLTRETSS